MSKASASTIPRSGWSFDRTGDAPAPSLPEVNATVFVPTHGSAFRRFVAFLGPGYMVSVGYTDPGNWATSLSGGAQFSYTLLSVIMLSNLMAILLQALAARLGIATGLDLAQACRRITRARSTSCSGSPANLRSSLPTLRRSSAPPSRFSSFSEYR